MLPLLKEYCCSRCNTLFDETESRNWLFLRFNPEDDELVLCAECFVWFRKHIQNIGKAGID